MHSGLRVRDTAHSSRSGTLQLFSVPQCQCARRRQQRRVTCQAAQAARKVVVVGAGVGGICLAGRLARKGFDVTVVEKNAEVGRDSGACCHACMCGCTRVLSSAATDNEDTHVSQRCMSR